MYGLRQLGLVCLSAWLLSVSIDPMHGQTIDLSLDLFYSDPSDTSSSGTWQLVAQASDRGIAGLDVRLADVNFDPTFEAPTGSGTGVAMAGFQPTFGGAPFFLNRGDHLEMLFGQIPVAAPGPQGLFYDVGVPGGATQPGENGTPAIAGFVGGTNVPWNFNDRLGDLLDDSQLNGSGPLEGSVLLASGSFDAGTQPGFFPGSATDVTAGNVFLDVGTATSPPSSIVQAAVATQRRSNSDLSMVVGDMDGDGDTDFDDIDPFRIGLANPASYAATYLVPAQLRGDTDGDGDLDFDDISGFVALLAGGSLGASAHGVPEPASGALVAIAMAGVIMVRRRKGGRRA